MDLGQNQHNHCHQHVDEVDLPLDMKLLPLLYLDRPDEHRTGDHYDDAGADRDHIGMVEFRVHVQYCLHGPPGIVRHLLVHPLVPQDEIGVIDLTQHIYGDHHSGFVIHEEFEPLLEWLLHTLVVLSRVVSHPVQQHHMATDSVLP